KRPLRALGAAVVLVNILVGIGANVIAPYDPLATDYGAMLARPSATHRLGADAFGRDVLPRLIYGPRPAMLVGFASAFLGGPTGGLPASPDHPAPHVAERDGAVSHPAHGVSRTGDPGRGVAHVPGPRCLGADAGVGAHAARRRRAVRRGRAVDGDLPGARDQPGRLRVQSVRRLVARCARSSSQGPVRRPSHGLKWLQLSGNLDTLRGFGYKGRWLPRNVNAPVA